MVRFWQKLAASRRPSSKSYETVSKAVEDQFTVAKLSFFSYIASLLEPYLAKYQTDNPMLPFLCKDLERLHRTLLQLIVKPTILDKCDSPSTLLKLRFCDQDIYLKAKDRHFGFSVEEELKRLLRQDQAAAADIKNFQNKASSMVISLLKKLTEKSPMHFCVVKNASVFDPALLVSLDSTGLRCSMKNLLTHLVSLKIVSATLAEKALLQYLDLLATINQQDLEKAKSFNYKDSRLDAFYFDEMSFKMSAQLTSILKLVLILSHGQSSVERGFNVNKDVVKANLQEKSVVSRKMIIDHMQKNNVSPSTIKITRKLARSVKAARQKYHLDREEQKKNAKKNECNEQLKILTAEIKDVMQKKNILLEVCQKLYKEFVDIVKDAKKKNDMGLIIKANALKRKSEEKRLEISTFDKAIEAMEAKRKKLQ